MSDSPGKPNSATEGQSKSIIGMIETPTPIVEGHLSVASTQSSEKSKSGIEVVRRRRVRKKRRASVIEIISARFKQVAWRITALWCWIHAGAHLMSGRGRFFYPERVAISTLKSFLVLIGFSPTDGTHFALLLKLGWIILICGFSIMDFLVFVIYVPTFPANMLYRLLSSRLHRKEATEAKPKLGLMRHRNKQLSGRFAIMLLVIWFLLYAQSSNLYVELAGVVISGTLLLQEAYSAFLFATPVSEVNIKMIVLLRGLTETFTAKQVEDDPNNLGTTASLISLGLFFQNVGRRMITVAFLLTRGKTARSRAALLVLLQYVIKLFFLGTTTVIFWGLVIRIYGPPSLERAFMASAARVLPGLAAPTGLTLPFWVETGSSLSAWILFVVYAGPAASVFPVIQQAYVNAVSDAYLVLRGAAVQLLMSIRRSEMHLAAVRAQIAKSKMA